MHYSAEKAQHVIQFIQQLTLTKGKWLGQPFRLLPWETELIQKAFGTLREDGLRQYRTVYVEIPKKSGKALAIDTPIPTPDGWTTMEALKPGDKVFDEKGTACHVVACTEVMYDRKCYEMYFSDGGRIVADGEHLWQVNEYKPFIAPYYETKILKTEEMKGNIKHKNGCYRYRIPVIAALDTHEKRLALPPYVLGVWLADGNSYNSSFTCNINDLEIADKVVGSGVEVRQWKSKNTGSVHLAFGDGDRSQAARNKSWQVKMRKMGLICNKHIPQEYLRGSIRQRKNLLKGLMDSDGYISKEGECEYTTVSKRLAEDVAELIRSLGLKCSIKEGRARLNGKDCGPKYRINFFTYRSNPVFSLLRKNERLKGDPLKPTKNSFRTITGINAVPSVPVKCIQVDSPSKLYLAGKNMVPTHNSELAAAIALYMLMADGESNAEVYVAACDRQQASIIFNTSVSFVEGNRTLSRLTKTVLSTKRIVYPNTGSYFQVLSSDVKSKSGLNVSCVILDEIWTYPNPDLAKMLTTGSGDAREQPLFLYLTTAGNHLKGYGWEMHNRAKDVLACRREDPTFLPIIYGLEEDDDWEDEANWYKSNPSLGYTIQIDRIRDHYRQAKQDPAEEALFKQLRLNMWLKQQVKWMPMETWDGCKIDFDPGSLEGRPCYGGLDLSSSTDITAFVLVFPPTPEDDRYYVLPHFWLPEDTLDLRVRRDHVPYDTWHTQGYIHTTEGNVIHYGFIEAFIEELGIRFNIQEIAFDRWGAVQMSQNLEGMGFTVIPFGQGYKDMSPPTKELMKLTLEKKLIHGGHPVLRWMMDNIYVKTDPAGNIKPDKEKSTERIDGAVALIMALDRAVRNRKSDESVYNDRGLLVF
ncbi:MAG: terminase TerL endonuclease subunit [Bacillota bacterium]|nr:terminase TerL endonuclease subunit [Bacillota bacterium]MDW7678524.1 terminase TerL endonuclease subunit [Bacillota bacterium]